MKKFLLLQALLLVTASQAIADATITLVAPETSPHAKGFLSAHNENDQSFTKNITVPVKDQDGKSIKWTIGGSLTGRLRDLCSAGEPQILVDNAQYNLTLSKGTPCTANFETVKLSKVD